MHLVANIKPCLLDDHPAFASLERAHALLRDSHNKTVIEPFWDGQGAHLDFTNPIALDWWQSQFKSQVLDYGIHSGWNDNNEYAIQDGDAVSQCWGTPQPIHRTRPLHGLLMTRATFEAQAQGFACVFVFHSNIANSSQLLDFPLSTSVLPSCTEATFNQITLK